MNQLQNQEKEMKDEWKDKWDTRYAEEQFAFGMTPNTFFKEQIDKLDKGLLLLPAEGEGRNAVYAATKGWSVSAFDISVEGKKKAMQLAEANKVTLDYQVGPLEEVAYEPAQFDALALIYAHFPAEVKSQYHKTLSAYLRPGGTVIFEAFSKRHLEYKLSEKAVGGPGNLDSLFSEEELLADFASFDVVELAENEIELNAGAYHSGIGSVMRFVGRKR